MCANPDWLFGLINREDRFNSTCDIATNNVYKDLNVIPISILLLLLILFRAI
jgi:hypothetical protein